MPGQGTSAAALIESASTEPGPIESGSIASDPVEPERGEPRPDRPAWRRFVALGNRLLMPGALIAVVVATVMVIWLHLLPNWGGVNPVTGMLSDYGILPDGWVFDTALDIISLASAAVLVKMARYGVLRERIELIAMASWCVCLAGVAAFTKDPNSGSETLRGAVHLYSTAAACGSLPLAALMTGWHHRRSPEWRRWAWISQGLAVLSVPFVSPFVISFFVIRLTHSPGLNAVPTGLVERLMGLLDLVILVVLALWAQRAAQRRPLLTWKRPLTSWKR